MSSPRCHSAHRRRFHDRRPRRRFLAQHGIGEMLAAIDGQRRARTERVGGGAVRAGGRVHAVGRQPFGHPCRQRGIGEGAAVRDVVGEIAGDLLPSRCLPDLEGPHRPAEAPAQRQIDVARVVRDLGEMHRAIVEEIAEDRPEELRLRMARRAELRELHAGILLAEDFRDAGIDAACGLAVLARGGVQHLDVLADLAEEAGLRLLAERALGDERGQHRRSPVDGMPRVVGQRVLHRLDDVRHRVEADHIAGAIGRALGAADRGTSQRIDHVERQLVGLGVRHRRQHREDADPVGDEIRRVLRAHDALAERRDDEGLERVEERRIGVLLRDQLDQVHVARRVEEVDAAEARPHRRGQRFRQRVDREPRGVGRDDRVRREVRRDLRVEIALPVHALGDRLDDEVAAGERGEVAVVVGGVDVGDAIRGRRAARARASRARRSPC